MRDRRKPLRQTPNDSRARPRNPGWPGILRPCLALAIALSAAPIAPKALAMPVTGPQDEPALGLDSPVHGAPDPFAAEHAFVELHTERRRWLVGEPVPVRIRIGIEARFQRGLMPFLRRDLSLPVQVIAPWLGSTAVLPTDSGRDSGGATLALNATVAHAVPGGVQRVDGKEFMTFELTRTLLPDQAGPLELAGTALRLSYATRFREDVFNGRTPKDPRLVLVAGSDLSLDIAPPPEAGRPLDFTGAIGEFSVRAEVDRDSLHVGEALTLTLRIEGFGNLGRFQGPRLPDMSRFAIHGRTEVHSNADHRVRWELAATHPGLGDIPALSFSFLQPGTPAEYRTVTTRAIQVEVLATEHPPTPASRPAPTEGAGGVPSSTSTTNKAFWIGGVLFASAVAGGLLLWLRLRRGAAPARNQSPGTGAAAALRARAAAGEADLGGMLCDYLGSRLGCSAAAVVGPGLGTRLTAAGIPGELAQRTATDLELWIGTRYGGPAPAGGGPGALSLVDELEAAFQRTRR